jgi:glycosyltransferase involved in cell wall biosynthesis
MQSRPRPIEQSSLGQERQQEAASQAVTPVAAQPRRVVMLASYAPSLWIFRGQLVAALNRRGYQVVACAPPHPGAVDRVRALGAEYVELGPDRTSLNPIADLKYFLELLRLCRRVEPVAVIGYTAKPVIWGALAGRLTGVDNVVAMITGLGFAFVDGAPLTLRARLIARLYRVALRMCGTVVFQNPDDLQEFIRRRILRARARTLVVNGSGVDLARFQPIELPGETVFLLIARLLHAKGIREYCMAASAVRARYPQAQFRLAGWFDDDNPDGISRGDLKRWCDRGGVEYIGPLEDVRSALARCRVYVLPSYREGTPRTVLEALAMGRPIITTDAPGCRETVRDGWNGFLVPPRDSAALAQAMERFLFDPAIAQCMAERSRQLAESKYDGHAVAESMLSGVGL